MPRRKPAPPPSLETALAPRSGEAAAEWAKTASLVPWADNPRKNEGAVQTVAESIKRFGWGAPIIARKADREIIAGHTRFKAALLLGLDEVPVRFLDLDVADAHLLALADNKTGEVAEWDDLKLGDILAELKRADIDLQDGTGFVDTEVMRLVTEHESRVRGPGATPPSEGSKTPEPPVLLFKRHRILLTEDESRQLDAKLEEYLDANGSPHGFAGRLVHAL